VEIDLKATKQAMTDTGRSINGWARCKGFLPQTVQNFLCGAFQANGPVGSGIIEQLRKDGLIRFKEAA
jgi:hypothetical protein